MNPAISVIVPVYKVENYLHRCIDSILSQSFTDFELISLDNSFDTEYKSTLITNRDPAGNYKGYVAMGDNVEIKDGKAYVDDLNSQSETVAAALVDLYNKIGDIETLLSQI